MGRKSTMPNGMEGVLIELAKRGLSGSAECIR